MLIRAAICLSLLVLLALAEQGVLVVHVANVQGQSLSGVRLSTLGDGSTGPPTDRAGKTRIRLAAQTRPGSWVSLQVVRGQQDLVFISPWDSRVRVPPFENESENFAPVVLAERGDRAVLEMGKTLASLAAKINAAAVPVKPKLATAEERRDEALGEISKQFGLNRNDLDRALRKLAAGSNDPYERGMSALYQGNVRTASQQLAEALQQRESAARPVAANIVNAAFFLGQALYEQGKYAEAAKALEKALNLRPDDPKILNLMGGALLKSGKPVEAEQYLRRGLELEEKQR